MVKEKVLFSVGMLALALVLQAKSAVAADYQYDYVSLDNLAMPPGYAGFAFYETTIVSGDRVYGNVCNDSFVCYAAVYDSGTVKVIQPRNRGDLIFTLSTANDGGVLGGSVSRLADPSSAQAAVLRDGDLDLLPERPGDLASFVVALFDASALVFSIDASGKAHYLIFRHGKVTEIAFDGIVTPSYVQINDRGIVAGTGGSLFEDARAFRLDTRTGRIMKLDPLPTEPLSWGLGINRRGDVLGYSFVSGATERIGVWDRKGRFQTYFVEGTPEFPTISNWLLFNDRNEIVITQAGGTSYLVPRPGTRLDLADLTRNLPAISFPLYSVNAINDRASIVGFGYTGNQFLLRRIGHDCSDRDPKVNDNDDDNDNDEGDGRGGSLGEAAGH
jgi:hypothetical protein